MNADQFDDEEGLSRYKIHARREIVSLLRSMEQRNQLVRMQGEHGTDAVVTSILHVDDDAGTVVIDCAPGRLLNERLQASAKIRFETVFENIRIMFSAPGASSCEYEDGPALSIALPTTVIRLQRREFYRVATPVSMPVKCALTITAESGPQVVVLPLANVSGGGVGMVDEKKLVPPDYGIDYENCRLDFPGSPVNVTLRLRNAQDVKLQNGKTVRRLGFMFVSPSRAAEASIQRYITKLEREQNARKAGLG